MITLNEAVTQQEYALSPPAAEKPHLRVWGIVRLLVAGGGIVALTCQLIFEIQRASARPEQWAHHLPTILGDFIPGTFTYLTTLVTAGVLILSAVFAVVGRDEPGWVSRIMFAASANMIFVGIFFNIALRWSLPDDAIMWINETVHVVLPVYVLVDCIWGSHARVPVRALWATAVLGLAWTLYTQVRGPFIIDRFTGEPTWYPYSFVDPAVVPGGVVGATVLSLVLVAIITGVGCALAAFTARKGKAKREL